MQYGHVTNNIIDEGPCALPSAWKNISGLNHLNDQELLNLGWMPWIVVNPPHGENQVYDGINIQINNNKIIETSIIRNMTEKEIADRENNKKNNNKIIAEKLLSETDWTQIPDVGLLNKQEFAEYRAIVRAIAINPPAQVTFPTLPTEKWS